MRERFILPGDEVEKIPLRENTAQLISSPSAIICLICDAARDCFRGAEHVPRGERYRYVEDWRMSSTVLKVQIYEILLGSNSPTGTLTCSTYVMYRTTNKHAVFYIVYSSRDLCYGTNSQRKILDNIPPL